MATWTRTPEGWRWNGWTAFASHDDSTFRRTWVLADPSGKRRKFGRLKDAKRFAEARTKSRHFSEALRD